MWPVSLVIAVSISSFTVWQVKSGYGWYRKEVDEISGETIGSCQGEEGVNSDLYLLPNYAMQLATIFAAGIMAWRTIGFDDDYSESKWVLALILVQLQVRKSSDREKTCIFMLILLTRVSALLSIAGPHCWWSFNCTIAGCRPQLTNSGTGTSNVYVSTMYHGIDNFPQSHGSPKDESSR